MPDEYINGCFCDGWGCYESEVTGRCPECDIETIDGEAAHGCNWSPVDCEACGSKPCDGSC